MDYSHILLISSCYIKFRHDTLIIRCSLSLDWIYDGQGSSKKVPEKSNLITDIKTLEENNRILMNEIKSLKKEFKKLHNEFFEFKHGMQKKDKAN